MIVTYPPEQKQSVPDSAILAVIPQDGQETAQWLIDQYHAAYADNCQLREQLAQIQEENEQLRAARCPHCQEQEKRTQRAEERANLYYEMHYRESEEHRTFRQWIFDLWKNPTIPVGCKVTILFLFIILGDRRDPIVGQEQQITLGEIATGCSEYYGTVSKHLAQFMEHGVIERREDEEAKKDKEDPKTIYYWTPQELMLHPADIDLQKKEHGGATKKGCRKDGTPLDRYTVTHCPTHGELGIYGQPGTRKEANQLEMIDDIIRQYPNRVPLALSNPRDPVTGLLQNQDAFSSQSPARTPTGQTSALTDAQQNQDAFTRGTPEEEIYIDPETEALGQRYNAAVEILAKLASYGYALSYLPDGKRELTRNTETASIPKGKTASLRKQIDQYNPELLSIWQDSQLAPTVEQTPELEPASQNQNQDAFTQTTQEPTCDLCHEREATGTIYQHGEARLNYCKACEHTATAQQLEAQYNTNLLSTASCGEMTIHQPKRPPLQAVCKAAFPLNKDGQPAHGLDKWVSSQPCNGTVFFWSDHDSAYCCRACLTPYRVPEI